MDFTLLNCLDAWVLSAIACLSASVVFSGVALVRCFLPQRERP